MATAVPQIREQDEAGARSAAQLTPGGDPMLLVERIAGSEPFQKSSRLPALLRYLAECTFRGDRAGLTEQAIGRAVFGKPADFHPTEDSSVRVHVRQLRLRLYEYFQSAGQDEPVIIEIPKGAYALALHERHTPAKSAAPDPVPFSVEPAPVPSLESPRVHVRSASWWIPWALCGALFFVAVAGWLRWYRAVAPVATPWPLNQVLEADRSTTMVLADASYVLRMLSTQDFTLDEYSDRRYMDGLIPPDATPAELGVFHYLRDAQITSMADARAVLMVTNVAGALRDQLVVRSAKELNGTAMLNGNFIIVGARNSNPWVELYEGRTNFRLREGGPHGGRYIENLAPLPGEQQFYAVHETTGYSGEDFATISLVRGLGDQGNTLLVQGLRREGTDAAILFLASSTHRAALEQALRAANHGKRPKYFEALLRSHAVAGSATSIDCIAVRPLSLPQGSSK